MHYEVVKIGIEQRDEAEFRNSEKQELVRLDDTTTGSAHTSYVVYTFTERAHNLTRRQRMD